MLLPEGKLDNLGDKIFCDGVFIGMVSDFRTELIIEHNSHASLVARLAVAKEALEKDRWNKLRDDVVEYAENGYVRLSDVIYLLSNCQNLDIAACPDEEGWKPEAGKPYHFIDVVGNLDSNTWRGDAYDKGHLSCGNVRPNKAEAEIWRDTARGINTAPFPKKGQRYLQVRFEKFGRGNYIISSNTWDGCFAEKINWRIGAIQPDTPAGRARLERTMKEWEGR